MLLSHLSKVSEARQYLIADAALNADAGRIDVALDDLDAAFRLGNSLQNEPLIVTQLTRQRFRSMIGSCVERMLNHGGLNDEQLAHLSNAFATNDFPAAMERAIAGEMCMHTVLFQLSPKERAMLFGGSSLGSPSSSFSASGIAHYLLGISGMVDRDFHFYLQTMIQYLWLSRVEFPERLDEAAKIDEQLQERLSRGHYMYSAMLLPSLNGISMREGEYAAWLKLVQTALALERYRLANGRKVPDTLNALTPTYFATVPADPFDGKPLRYQKLEKGYMLYSVGRDRKDDGGVLRDPKKPGSGEDIIFKVER
jgi:hypothetical protein